MKRQLLVISVGIGCAWLSISAVAHAQGIWRVDTASDGSQIMPDDWIGEGLLSEDGRYALFSARSAVLVAGITGDYYQQFVKDRLTGVTTCVSVDSSGNAGNDRGWAQASGISRDGRFACFESDADNLVPGDTNNTVDVFVHDRQKGITSRVSVDSAGVEGNDISRNASLTPDGRYVLFCSLATNLVPNDSNGQYDLFLHDRLTATTTRVNLNHRGNQARNGDSKYGGVYLPDVQLVVFDSTATNMVKDDTNNNSDVFVRDLQAGTTTRVSVDSNGNEVLGGSLIPSASDDGRYVFFQSNADTLVPNDTNNAYDVFMRDRQNSTTVRISVDANGNEADEDCWLDSWSHSSCSADGRFVVFTTKAMNLVEEDRNFSSDTFVKDTVTGAIRLVSLAWNGEPNNSRWGTYFSNISRDGRFQAFKSGADNMVPNDTNDNADVFVVGPFLTLEASPETVASGATLTLTTWTGSPTTPALLVTVAVNGVPVFAPLLLGSLDAQGIWVVSGQAPPSLSGNALTLMSFGFTPPGTHADTNEETVTFQ